MKECTDCKKIKPYTEFHKEKKAKDGYRNQCKDCTRKRKAKIENVCVVCGTKFKSTVTSKYCSRKCQGLDSENKIKTECSICGKEIYRIPAMIARHKRHYCSENCKNEGFSKYYSGENAYWYNSNKSEEERIVGRKIPSYFRWRRLVYERDNYCCRICGCKENDKLNAHHIMNYSEYEELRVDVNNGITMCKECHKDFHTRYGYKNNNFMQLVNFIIDRYVNTEVNK